MDVPLGPARMPRPRGRKRADRARVKPASPSRFAALVAMAALLILGWPMPPAKAQMLRVPTCRGGTVDLPIGPERPSHDKSCPVACHAPLRQDRKGIGKVA